MKHLRHSHCLIGVAIAAVLVIAQGVSASTLALLAVVLACPLMMLFMMRTMGADHARAPHEESPTDGSLR